MCMSCEASLPCSQSCKGTWVYYRAKNLHLYSIKNDRKTTMVVSMASWIIKQKTRFNFISFLTVSHFELNIITIIWKFMSEFSSSHLIFILYLNIGHFCQQKLAKFDNKDAHRTRLEEPINQNFLGRDHRAPPKRRGKHPSSRHLIMFSPGHFLARCDGPDSTKRYM